MTHGLQFLRKNVRWAGSDSPEVYGGLIPTAASAQLPNLRRPMTMSLNTHRTQALILRLAALAVIALMGLLAAACQSIGDQADSAAAADSSQEAADTATLEVTFKEQDARQLAIRMRRLLADGMQVSILAPDSRTWIVSGTASDVRTIKHLAKVLDRTILTPEHVVRSYDIEHQDARLLAVSSRGTAPKGASWGIVVSPEGRWHVILPQDELVAFEAWLDEIDSPS